MGGGYLSKVKRRLVSLVIPYISWNLLFIGLSFIVNSKFQISDYGVIDFLLLFWDANDGTPICYPMWFVRDLIIVCIISPIVFFINKRIPYISILFLILPSLVRFSFINALCLFSLGAFFSINKKEIPIDKQICLIVIAIYLLLTVSFNKYIINSDFILTLVRTLGCIPLYCLSYLFSKRYNIPDLLSNSVLYTLCFSSIMIIAILRVLSLPMYLQYFTTILLAALCSFASFVVIQIMPMSFVLTGKKSK